MGSLSDEAAGAAAAEAGEGGVRMARHPRLYMQEPWRWDKGQRDVWVRQDQPELFFRTPRPICERCGAGVKWLGVEAREDGTRIYRVSCSCPGDDGGQLVDEIEVDFRLCMGGDREWWVEVWGYG